MRYIYGLSVTCNREPHCLILAETNAGKVYDENEQDVEALIQGKPLKADSSFGIKAVPHEPIQIAITKH